MPELPEAETIARTLAPHVEGRRILSARFFTRRVCGGPIPDLAGRGVRRVGRYGKQIVIELDAGVLVVQLRMTGLLLWRAETGAYTRARLEFAHGACCFDDIRQFGSIRYREGPPDGLGPDPLEIDANSFIEAVRARRRMVKPLLLDQQFLRGLGNIYVDEILFRAGLDPTAVASGISRPRLARLHEAMREVLGEAIRHHGSSISDYVDADGRKGRFQRLHRVYRRAGEPCPGCGEPIRRIVVGQRGTHYCPRCQRR